MHKLKVLDLFCGIGGFSTGFLMADGFEIKAGVDIEDSMRKNFIKNHSGAKFLIHDIKKDVPSKILKIKPDIIIGSPPCQGFSDARGVRYWLDRRNDLVFRFLKWVEIIRPKIVVMENVKGMITIGKAWKSLEKYEKEEDIDFMELLENEAKRIGYLFQYKVLDSKDFGVPQNRERVFCLMVKKELGLSVTLPESTHKKKRPSLDKHLGIKTPEEKHKLPYVTVEEAIDDLPFPYKYRAGNELVSVQHKYSESKSWFQELIIDTNCLRNHVARFPKDEAEIKIIKRIPENKMYRSDRRGDRYVGVWDLYVDQLSRDERDLLQYISVLRLKDNIKTKKGVYDEGYVPLKELRYYSTKLINNLVTKGFLKTPAFLSLTKKAEIAIQEIEYTENSSQIKALDKKFTESDLIVLRKLAKFQESLEAREGIPNYIIGIQNSTLKRLKDNGWIFVSNRKTEYDLTAKAGHRGKYARLPMKGQSPTLTTQFSNFREFLHPIQNRGLSLREGARLMSFPDSFSFYGNFNQISIQIGNAVAPLVAKKIALQILEGIKKQ